MPVPPCFFWKVWRERNRMVFDNKKISVHRMKISFFFFFNNLWSWTNTCIVHGPPTLLVFCFCSGVDEGWWVLFLLSLSASAFRLLLHTPHMS